MSSFRTQQKLTGDVRPIVTNVMNVGARGGRAPTLLSFDDARTLFHELGHGLHGLLSDVTYPIAGDDKCADAISSSCRRSFMSTGCRSLKC